MKKIIISFVSLIVFLLVKGITPVNAAVNDLSGSFTQIKLNNRGQLVHVKASLDCEDKLQAGDTMTITWQADSNQLKARGINQTKDLFINKKQIGTYTINDDYVLLRLNANVENYSDIHGKIGFDIQVDNLTDSKQRLMFYAGDHVKSIFIAPQNPIGTKISGKVAQNSIAWEIQILPYTEAMAESVELENIIPSNLAIDKHSLIIEANGRPVQLEEDAVKIDKNKLFINLTQYLTQVITIKYNTEILDSILMQQPNVVKLNYQIAGEQEPILQIDKGWVNEAQAYFTGTYRVKRENSSDAGDLGAKEKVTHTISELLDLFKKKNENISSVEENTAEKELKTVSLPQVESEKLVDSSTAKIKANDLADKTIKRIAATNQRDQPKDSDNDKAIKNERTTKRSTYSDKILPRAGEATDMLSLLGIALLLVGGIGFKAKFFK